MQNLAVTLFWFCFNSTLVQLKVGFDSATMSAKLCFNSTLVQLKVVSRLWDIFLASCFNSTLVQLKD